ncbi:MAG: hypothetical protein RIC16_03195 [Rhodospirillales bacterium]
MIKKFVSNALLSMVMDKSARKKLATMRGEDEPPAKTARKKKKPELKNPARQDSREPNPIEDAAAAAENLAQTIELALADARVEAMQPKTSNPTPKKKPSPFDQPAKPMTPDREQLIRDAINIHQQKSKVLDNLDPAVREKLTVMAMMALDPDSLPGGGKPTGGREPGGPVDDIGGGRKKPLKRR